MTPNNNLSVLPFYDSIDQQDRFKWWVYGKKYPLYSKQDYIIPCQIIRPASSSTSPTLTDTFCDPRTTLTDYWINSAGASQATSPDSGSDVEVYRIGNDLPTDIPAGQVICVRYPEQFSIGGVLGKAWTIVDENYATLATGNDIYIDLADYPTAKFLYLETYDDHINGRIYLTSGSGIPTILLAELYTADGDFVADVFKPSMWAGKQVGADQIIYTPHSTMFPITLGIGQYYLHLSDGRDDYYSDVFTVVEDTTPLVEIMWWDDEDFVMDSGAIAYTSPWFRNRLLLPIDIAKPEYTFEEEGETRDGYFYAFKQVSSKKYRFKMWAPEYLLDVMRFIRMSDHIMVYDHQHSNSYSCDSFLITPEWEQEGDIASVEVEFTAGTVAKKIGG